MWLKPIPVLDDRGRGVHLFELRQAAVTSKSDPVLYDVAWRVSVMAQQQAHKNITIGYAVRFGSVFILVSAVALSIAGLTWVPGWMKSLPIPIGLIIGMTWVSRWHRSNNAQRVVNAMLAYGRCASCGYALAGMEVDPEGVIQCPECGSAWKAERVKLPSRGEPAGAGQGPIKTVSPRSWFFGNGMFRAPTVVDSAGIPLPLISRDRLRDEKLVSSDVLREVRSATRGQAWGWVGLLVLVVPYLAYIAFGPLSRYGVTRGASSTMNILSWVWLPLPVMMLCLHAWNALKGRGQGTAQKVADLLVKNGTCPVCGVRLSGGNTRCDCGAQWDGPLHTALNAQ